MNILSELCQELRNWFDRDQEKWIGKIAITNDEITVDGAKIELLEGQYYRVIGSLLNDGVYQYPDSELKDEEFDGAVWSMAIPPSVADLANEIGIWCENNADKINSPYQSESFGGYSYTLKSGGSTSTDGSGGFGWRTQFADRLNRWRKL